MQLCWETTVSQSDASLRPLSTNFKPPASLCCLECGSEWAHCAHAHLVWLAFASSLTRLITNVPTVSFCLCPTANRSRIHRQAEQKLDPQHYQVHRNVSERNSVKMWSCDLGLFVCVRACARAWVRVCLYVCLTRTLSLLCTYGFTAAVLLHSVSESRHLLLST